MAPTDMLKAAEADLVALVALPGDIRAKVKAGVAELTQIRDQIDALITAEKTRAADALAKLKAVAAEAEAAVPAA